MNQLRTDDLTVNKQLVELVIKELYDIDVHVYMTHRVGLRVGVNMAWAWTRPLVFGLYYMYIV